MPAKAGIQADRLGLGPWIPAGAEVTDKSKAEQLLAVIADRSQASQRFAFALARPPCQHSFFMAADKTVERLRVIHEYSAPETSSKEAGQRGGVQHCCDPEVSELAGDKSWLSNRRG